MAMRWNIKTPQDLISALEGRKNDYHRQQVGASTQKESIRLGAMTMGLDEAIYFIHEYILTLAEEEAKAKADAALYADTQEITHLRCPWCGKRHTLHEDDYVPGHRMTCSDDPHIPLLTRFEWNEAHARGELFPAFDYDELNAADDEILATNRAANDAAAREITPADAAADGDEWDEAKQHNSCVRQEDDILTCLDGIGPHEWVETDADAENGCSTMTCMNCYQTFTARF